MTAEGRVDAVRIVQADRDTGRVPRTAIADPARLVALLAQQPDLSPTVAEKARRRIAGLKVRVEW